MSVETKEYFPIKKVVYDPKAPKENTLVFRHYNENEVILGKPMHEWLRFSVVYWHTFRGTGSDPFGDATFEREYDDRTSSVENAKRRMTAAFEFMSKLGVKYWAFHDRDIAPAGKTVEETNKILDEVVAHAKQLQANTGIKLLWGTANLFSHPRFMNGAATNPDLDVFVRAAAQIKKAMEVTKELNGSGYVFWGGREGFQSYLNTDIKRELDHLGMMLKMAADFKHKIGFGGTLLIEPKPKEPTKHQYDYDAQTVMGFLRAYGLEKEFKLNIEPNHTTLAGHAYEHDIIVASKHGMLGSIDCNTGDAALGWDTDQFPTDLKGAVMIMDAVIGQNGIAPGGLNFDAKLRRESTDLEDLFISHVAAMDLFALALRIAAKLHTEATLASLVKARYSSWDSALGSKIEQGKATLEELEQLAKHAGNKEPTTHSAKQEKYEAILNNCLIEGSKL